MYDPAEFASRALDEEFARMGPYGHGVYDIIITAKVGVRTSTNRYHFHSTLNPRPTIDLETFGVTSNTMGG